MTRPAHLDLLALAAHPDDADLLAGGTLAKAAARGRRAGILDLTRGEAGTRGSAETRQAEAEAAARVLGLAGRWNAGLPDASLENSPEARLRVVEFIRELAPRVVILPYRTGRHPDHRIASELGYDACFLSGLAKVESEHPPHRPHKILYASAFREDAAKPTFVVDISDQLERKIEALECYLSQFGEKTWAGEVFPGGCRPLLEQVRMHAARYGSLIRKRYGEPFWTVETLEVEDVTELPVRSI
ncbi:MAG: bacillithiol biosynthesis deacetylase BshB1 [Longimicrobiaceae bacterium]